MPVSDVIAALSELTWDELGQVYDQIALARGNQVKQQQHATEAELAPYLDELRNLIGVLAPKTMESFTVPLVKLHFKRELVSDGQVLVPHAIVYDPTRETLMDCRRHYLRRVMRDKAKQEALERLNQIYGSLSEPAKQLVKAQYSIPELRLPG